MKRTSPRTQYQYQDTLLEQKEILSPTFTPHLHNPTLNECSFTQERGVHLNFQDKAVLNYLFKGEITDDCCEDDYA